MITQKEKIEKYENLLHLLQFHMNKQLTVPEIKAAINAFQDASFIKTGSYAYSSGFLGSTLAGVMADMPEDEQQVIMRWLSNTAP